MPSPSAAAVPRPALGQRWASAPFWAAALAAAMFIGMDATVKGLAPRYGALQLTFFRFASGAVFAIVIWSIWRTPVPGPGKWRMHLLRSVLLMATLALYFRALTLAAAGPGGGHGLHGADLHLAAGDVSLA